MTDQVWQGAEQLREYLVPVDEIERYPGNPRRGQVEEIAKSLARFGQVRPLLVAGHRIVAGNHTYLAARQLGWTHVAVVQHEFEGETEARAYLLADNRLPELGGYDDTQLLALLAEVESRDAWDGTGYSADDLDDLRAMHGQVQMTEPGDFRGGYAADPAELAARASQLAGGRTMREMLLLLTKDQNEAFEADVSRLRTEYASEGVSDAVARSVRGQALLLNQGP